MMEREKDLLFWLWLAEALGPANRSFRELIVMYENPYDIFCADTAELERIPNLPEKTLQALSDKRLQRAGEILSFCEEKGIGILPYGDARYPYDLQDIQSPPTVLYYRGTLPDMNARLFIGVVGTRNMSAYGMDNAYRLSYELSTVGAVVVSGMATGIDGVSASAALRAGGTTVAILGGGVDVVYPAHHQKLYELLMEKGCILSEFAPGTVPRGYHFPIRNRIISGLSRATVVVEAGMRSGSLITARDAILQGRDVYAVPANVGTRGAEGTNGLLRDGAHMATCSEDILRNYVDLYGTQLRLDLLEDAKKNSRTDPHYLHGLNVIELTRRGEIAAPVSAVPQPAESEKKTAKRKPKDPTPRVGDPSAPKPAAAGRRQTQNELQSPRDTAGDERRTEQSGKGATLPQEAPEAVLATLNEVQRAVLMAIPDDGAVSTDVFPSLGFPYGDVISALTMLEIMGLIQKLPGSLYTRA